MKEYFSVIIIAFACFIVVSCGETKNLLKKEINKKKDLNVFVAVFEKVESGIKKSKEDGKLTYTSPFGRVFWIGNDDEPCTLERACLTYVKESGVVSRITIYDGNTKIMIRMTKHLDRNDKIVSSLIQFVHTFKPKRIPHGSAVGFPVRKV